LTPGKLWRFNRSIEISQNRAGLLIWTGAFLLLLMLMPYPAGWEQKLHKWIKGHLPLLAALAMAAFLLFFCLDSFPGLHKDEAMVGDSAFSQHWYGIAQGNISAWAWSDFTAKLILLAQQVFPLDLFSVRIFAVLFSFSGLIFCGLAVERLLSKRAAVLTVLFFGTAAWYLGHSRLAYELLISSMFVFGGTLLGLAIAKRNALAGY
jgi:hypothetical protein